MYESVLWLKTGDIVANPSDAALNFNSDDLRGTLKLYSSLYASNSPQHSGIEAFVKVNAKYYAGSEMKENELESTFTTDGMVSAVRFSLGGMWSVSRWRHDYNNKICSFILSRRLPINRAGHLQLLMREIMSFLPADTSECLTELELEFHEPSGSKPRREVISIKKIAPKQTVALTGISPVKDISGMQYAPLSTSKPSFSVGTTVFGKQAFDVRVKRIEEKKTVELKKTDGLFCESSTLPSLLDNLPGSVAYRAELVENGLQTGELITRIYSQPARLVLFRPKDDNSGKLEWYVTGANELYINRVKNTGINTGNYDCPKNEPAQLLIPFAYGYIAAELYTLKIPGFYLRRTVTVFWRNCLRVIKLEWGAVRPEAAPYFINKMILHGSEDAQRLLTGNSGVLEYLLQECAGDYHTLEIDVTAGNKSYTVVYDFVRGAEK